MSLDSSVDFQPGSEGEGLGHSAVVSSVSRGQSTSVHSSEQASMLVMVVLAVLVALRVGVALAGTGKLDRQSCSLSFSTS